MAFLFLPLYLSLLILSSFLVVRLLTQQQKEQKVPARLQDDFTDEAGSFH